jgi:hypothetical protein
MDKTVIGLLGAASALAVAGGARASTGAPRQPARRTRYSQRRLSPNCWTPSRTQRACSELRRSGVARLTASRSSWRNIIIIIITTITIIATTIIVITITITTTTTSSFRCRDINTKPSLMGWRGAGVVARSSHHARFQRPPRACLFFSLAAPRMRR